MYEFDIPNGIVWSVAFEPLPTIMTRYGDLKGGNSLGTSPRDGNAVGKCYDGPFPSLFLPQYNGDGRSRNTKSKLHLTDTKLCFLLAYGVTRPLTI